MVERPLRGYRAIGHENGGLPAGYEEPSNEPVIELDEAALAGYEDP
jgi:hypothetical protein